MESGDTQRNFASPEAELPGDIVIGGRSGQVRSLSEQKLCLIIIPARPTRSISLTKVFRIIPIKVKVFFVCGELLFLYIKIGFIYLL